MKQKALLSSIRTLWLASMAAVAFTSMPVVSLAQSPKNFVEETEHAVKRIQNDQDEPHGERVFAMPYLTNNTRYKVISDIYSNPLYMNPAKRNVLDLKNETCKNREKRNVLKISHTRHFKTTKSSPKRAAFIVLNGKQTAFK